MDKRTNSQAIGLIALMVMVTCVVAYYSLRGGQRQSLPPLTVQAPPPAASSPGTSDRDTDAPSSTVSQSSQNTVVPPSQEILVHVAGAVFRPDVYRLPAGSRVNDAIRAAGGATQYADTNSINLAAPIQDGSKINVPQYGDQANQVQSLASRSTGAASAPTAQANQQSQTDQADAGSQVGNADQSQDSGKLSDASQGVVNINTATTVELQRLPGVGPAIAQRIIDYRQANGGFKSPEELKNVSGIGEKKFAKLAAFITVG